MLKSSAALLAAVLVMANAQSPSPFFSFGGGGGPPSPSPFSNIGPSSSPYGRPGPGGGQLGGGRPGGFPGSRPPPRQNAPSKLFSWLGSTMSKLPGLVPKIHYHSSKPNSSPLGRPGGLGSLGGLSTSAQNAPPTYFSSGGPPRESLILPQIPNSIYDGSGDGGSPFGNGGSVTFGSPNSIDHPRVNYRSPLGPPPSGFGSRPGPSSSPFASRPASRPLFSFLSGGPSFSSGGPSYSQGRPSQFSPSPYPSTGSPFGGSQSGPRPYSSPPQGLRNNLEVFPSQQVSYQSETLSQNEPGYNDALSGLQNLYGSQSNNKPSFAAHSTFQQQTSYSQPQQQVRSGSNNYGANFHSIEPVRVAPIYDVAQHFKSSSPDLNGAGSAPQRQHQTGNIHDTPFASLVNDYAAHADASTAGSNQMLSALQAAGSDLMSASTNNHPIPGVQILGNGNGNPMFEVMAGPNAPTFDGHPIDLNKLISMIEPGAQIDTIPNYGGDAQVGSASEQQPVYAEAPSNLEMESDAAMSSESRPTVVKLDGTRLNDDSLIKEHFDKDLILDDGLQGSNEDSGFIIVGVKADDDVDNQTGDYDDIPDPNGHLQGTENSSQNTDDDNETIFETDDKNNINDKDLLAIIQQLRNSAAVLSTGSSDTVPNSNSVTNENNLTGTTQHPNHNYNPAPIQSSSESSSEEVGSQRDNVPKINPIFDSVRPGRTMSIRTSVKSSTSVETDNDNNNDQDSSASSEYHRQLHLVDKDIDDDEMLPDSDLYIESEGDLAASASRNVKSVAIIVTPPPHYVRIKNKYKKAVTPRSSLTSTTTPLPLQGEDGNEREDEPKDDSRNINNDRDDVFSESLKSSNITSHITTTTTPSSSLGINSNNDNDDQNDDADDDDSMLKIISGIRNGRGSSDDEKVATIPTSSAPQPSLSPPSAETAKRPRLYPVYRRNP